MDGGPDHSPAEPSFIDLTEPSFRLRNAEGFVAEGDVLGVEMAVHAGATPLLVNPQGWAVPNLVATACTTEVGSASPERIAVMDELVPIAPGIALLRPPSLLVGLVLEEATTKSEVLTLLTTTLASAGLARSSVAGLVVRPENHAAVEAMALGHAVVVVQSPEHALDPEAQTELPNQLEALVLGAAGAGARICVRERTQGALHICVARRRADADITTQAKVTHGQ